MNSTLKPVLSQSGVPQAATQTSPAKANVATANHAVALPQGALNSVNHSANNLVGQNLSHQVANTPPVPPHAAPSMAPVSANMAQMAANMSHHGNLSLVTQNAVAVTNNAASPTKSASSSAPLSLVQDKPNTPPQPLALTRSPEKKEPDSTGQSNGSVESPTPTTNELSPLKPVNTEIQSDKQDIAKTSPSTPKPPESSSPAKPENSTTTSTTNQPESPVQPKVATANDSIKPAKPSELKATPAADVAPIADDKPLVESANDNQNAEKPAPPESSATLSPTETKEEKSEKPVEPAEEKTTTSSEDGVKPESSSQDTTPKEAIESKTEKSETKTKAEVKSIAKSTIKVATVTPPLRKRRHLSDKTDGATPPKKTLEADTPSRTKRNRTQVQPYQASVLDSSVSSPGPSSATKVKEQSAKKSKDKLRLFVSREYVAVRNEENGYYICQLLQHVYRTSGVIRVRWLSQVSSTPTGDVYKPDYCDEIDTGCLMTTLELRRAASGGGLVLRASERARVRSILQRALDAAAAGTTQLDVSEEHPDGLDVTLVTDESQLERKSRKRTSSKASPKTKEAAAKDSEEETPPAKKSRSRSSKGKTKSPKKGRKSAGSTPVVASTSKTATTVTDTPKNKNKKKGAEKKEVATPTPTKGRRSTREIKSTPVSPEPSTSTGKGTRSAKKK